MKIQAKIFSVDGTTESIVSITDNKLILAEIVVEDIGAGKRLITVASTSPVVRSVTVETTSCFG
jgi:hypothetical protein